MKVSKTPTPWLLIVIEPSDDKTTHDFALVHLTTERQTTLREQLNSRQQVWQMPGFQCVTVEGSPEGWYVNDGYGIEWYLAHQLLDWTFIEFEDAVEFGELRQVATPLTKGQLHFYRYAARFSATTIPTGTRMETKPFPLEHILEWIAAV